MSQRAIARSVADAYTPYISLSYASALAIDSHGCFVEGALLCMPVALVTQCALPCWARGLCDPGRVRPLDSAALRSRTHARAVACLMHVRSDDDERGCERSRIEHERRAMRRRR